MVQNRRRFPARVLCKVPGVTLREADLSGRDLHWENPSGLTGGSSLRLLLGTVASRQSPLRRSESLESPESPSGDLRCAFLCGADPHPATFGFICFQSANLREADPDGSLLAPARRRPYPGGSDRYTVQQPQAGPRALPCGRMVPDGCARFGLLPALAAWR